MARILIVSSDDLLAEVVRVTLSDERITFERADSPAAFHRLTERHTYDLVVVTMLGLLLSGRPFFSRLRPQGCNRPPIFVLVWHQTEETVLALLEAGVDQVISFPFHPSRLRAKAIASLSR